MKEIHLYLTKEQKLLIVNFTKQLSSEQDVLFEIDEAIRRIENGTYGICEMTDEPINIERLEALPYVRHSIKAQSD